MLHRDYLMRQIEQLSQVLARVLFKKSNQEYEEALQAIDEAFAQELNHNVQDLRQLPVDQLVEVCSTSEGLFPQLALRVADLLYQDGKIRAKQENDRQACPSFVRALALYVETVFCGASTLPWDLFDKVNRLLAITQECKMPETLVHRVQKLKKDGRL